VSQRLQNTQRVTLNASGSGTVSFGPARPREKWIVKRVAVQVSSTTLEAQAKIYRGTVGVGSYISGTVTGSTGDTDDGLSEVLWSGETLSVQWTGGDVGATATVTYWGDIDVQ
jgi:hypothetical protein